MKKKILLLSDDIRTYTGVGIISKQLVLGTLHKYDWVQLAAKSHPNEQETVIDVSQSANELTGRDDSYVRLYPATDYGNETSLRGILKQESPDMVLCFTDPRFWGWLCRMEREIRKNIPLSYYHVWDNYPYPKTNKPTYDSFDWIGCISKLTYDVVKTVCPSRKPWQTTYVPHGVCSKTYHPIENEETLVDYRKELVPNSDKLDYIVLCNNANLHRKQLPTLLMSFKEFCDTLPTNKQKSVALILHTNPRAAGGCNVYDIANSFGDGYNIYISEEKLTDEWLNRLYNIVDVTINIASNEGFGLSTLESLMTATPIITHNTGGLIDQCGEGGEGEWAYVINPTLRNPIGSQSVPYLYEDLCSRASVVDGLRYWYEMSKEDRQQKGVLGHGYAVETFNLESMCKPFIKGMDTTFKNFKPRARFECTRVTSDNTQTYLDKE